MHKSRIERKYKRNCHIGYNTQTQHLYIVLKLCYYLNRNQ